MHRCETRSPQMDASAEVVLGNAAGVAWIAIVDQVDTRKVPMMAAEVSQGAGIGRSILSLQALRVLPSVSHQEDQYVDRSMPSGTTGRSAQGVLGAAGTPSAVSSSRSEGQR